MDQVTESKVIGVATPRIDGPLKVSGSAMYASDHNFPGLLTHGPSARRFRAVRSLALTPLEQRRCPAS